jgi:hypothetical protein
MRHLRKLRSTAIVVIAAVLVLGVISDRSVTASMKPRPAGTSPTFAPVAAADWISVAGRGVAVPELAAEPSVISLSNGIRFDTRAGGPSLPAALRLEAEAGLPGFYLVQFAGPIEESWKADIEALGGRFHAYIPNYAFVVRLPAEASETVSRLAPVTWIGPYHPAYKLSAAEEMTPGRTNDIYLLQVFEGESNDAASAAIAAAGGTILEASNGRNHFIRFQASSDALAGIASEPTIAWIEPWHQMMFENSSAQWVVQTWVNGSRRIWDMGIHGENQIVSTADSGIRTTHYQYRDAAVPITAFGDYPTHRKITAYVKTVESTSITFGDDAGNQYHGTHTNATVAGDDSPFAADARDGMALKARIYFCDGGGTAAAGVFVPIDLTELFIKPYTGNAAGAARIMSNSWGSPVAGAYDLESMALDQFVWEHKDFLPFFSNGNNSSAGTVGSPATAKDCVSVGGTGNGTSANTLYISTSRGPADDGRYKPTICAPGNNVSSAYGTTDTGYIGYSGTSMASPCAAGATTLMRQYVMDGWYPTGTQIPANGFTPSAALMKAMAVNSADNDVTGQTNIPNNNIGWGRVDADKVLYFSGDARKTALVDFTAGLLTGDYVEYQIQVVDNTIPLKAAVVWSDYPSTPTAAINLVNDLNLLATDPSAVAYKGNVYSTGQSTTGGTADVKNVEECVQRNTPALGTWTFRITAANVPYGPQPFALVVSGGLASGFAVLQMDKVAYGAGETVQIRVTDADAALPLSVTISSTTETTPETVSLSGGSGIFTGSIPLSLDSPVTDGLIQVSDGDVLTVSYVDVSTITAQAMVNISGPTITNVHAGSPAQDGATVTWTTSSPANSRVYYGTTPALGQSSALDPTLVASHSLVLTGLDINQTYFFDVESYDNQGNGVRDDNGGAHYTFTTDPRKDVLVVIGDGTFTKRAYYENALNARGWTYNIWEGLLSEPPLLGDMTNGMRSFKAVVWQTGLEQYPQITDVARDSLAALSAGGARWAIYSHDVAWDFGDATSPDYTAARKAWLESELKAIWQVDPAAITSIIGYAGDPISASYTAGVPYTAFRAGGAGDEINPSSVGGTSVVSWKDNGTPDDVAIRFTSTGALGTPGTAVWGGQVTKISANFYEWSQLNAATTNDATRADILDKTLIWLLGRDHPNATVTYPNGGQVILAAPVSISWTESADAGYNIASRAIYYSDNAGESWTLISSSPGVSPYSWDITGLPNGNRYLVRVAVSDDGSPVLSGRDASDAVFTLNVPGGDVLGPVVVAGSIAATPNPIVSGDPSSLQATLTDQNTGASNVTEAEWSGGSSAAPPGSGTAMTGSFGSVTVNVTAALPAYTFSAGQETLWVRGRDAAGVWGSATRFIVKVNGALVGVEGGLPAVFALAQNAPNPFNPVTMIRFALPAPADVRLDVFDVTGRVVRTLIAGRRAAGVHAATWDGRDDRGSHSASGIYFYRLVTPENTAVRKMAMLK